MSRPSHSRWFYHRNKLRSFCLFSTLFLTICYCLCLHFRRFSWEFCYLTDAMPVFALSRSRNTVVAIATRHVLDGSGFESRQGHENFSCQISGFVYDCWILEDGPNGCPETSANNYQRTLRNRPEERGPQIFSSKTYWPYLGSTRPPIQWVPSGFPGDKAVGAWSLTAH